MGVSPGCFLIQSENLCLLRVLFSPFMLNAISDIFEFESSVWLWSNCYLYGKIISWISTKTFVLLVLLVDESEKNMTGNKLSQWYISSIWISMSLWGIIFCLCQPLKWSIGKICGLRITFFRWLYHNILNQEFKKEWRLVSVLALTKIINCW